MKRGATRSLAAIDLNLLVAFEALYAERSVTRAGRRLGLSQPAMSGALARLRAALGDELFVRGARGLEPTERGEELAGPVGLALRGLREALEGGAFDPRAEARTFHVGAVDAVIAALLPGVVARLVAEAPAARLAIRPIDPGRAVELLDGGELDLAMAPLPAVPMHVGSAELFRLDGLVAMRPGHPLAGRALGLDELAAYPWVIVAFAGTPRGALDEALAAAGKQRRVAVVVGSFLAVPPVLRACDALAVLPGPFARQAAEGGRLVTAPLPPGLPFPDLRMRMLWPLRQDRAPASRWLRRIVADAARELPPG